MLIALSGPSGIGKGYIKQNLLSKYPNLQELTWTTTRPARAGAVEQNREHVTLEIFCAMQESGLLTLVQNLYGHSYGLRRTSLFARESLAVTEFHPDNVLEALTISPDICVVGLVTDDINFLKSRLLHVRKTESEVDIAVRITAAKHEMATLAGLRDRINSLLLVNPATEDSIACQVTKIVQQYLSRSPHGH